MRTPPVLMAMPVIVQSPSQMPREEWRTARKTETELAITQVTAQVFACSLIAEKVRCQITTLGERPYGPQPSRAVRNPDNPARCECSAGHFPRYRSHPSKSLGECAIPEL